MDTDETTALVLRGLVDQYLPAKVPPLQRSWRRTVLAVLGVGCLLVAPNRVHGLDKLFWLGVLVLISAIVPSVWSALGTVIDHETVRRNRQRERDAMLAGGYRDVAVVAHRTSSRGSTGAGVSVVVVAKDGTEVTLPIGDDAAVAEHVARRLFTYLDPALREEYEAKPVRQVAD